MCCSAGKWGALVALLAILVLGFTFYSGNGKAVIAQNTSNFQGCDCADDHPNCHCTHCSGNGGACPCEDKESGKSDVKVQEHPGEHPGHKATPKADEPDMKKMVEDTVSHYTKRDSKVKGAFLVLDPKESDVWMFKEASLYHPIRKIDDTHYFLCSDWEGSRMKDSAKHKVDLDFFLTKMDKGISVDRVVVHKVDDKEYPRGAVCPMHKDVQMFCPTCGPCPVCGMDMKENKK